jgi:hypothetical protein
MRLLVALALCALAALAAGQRGPSVPFTAPELPSKDTWLVPEFKPDAAQARAAASTAPQSAAASPALLEYFNSNGYVRASYGTAAARAPPPLPTDALTEPRARRQAIGGAWFPTAAST